MVVLQPIKPGPPKLSFSLKRGRARRALSLLGNNNSQKNLELAESLLTISAEDFANKWNFDPINGVPLTPGRFQWTPLTGPNSLTSTNPSHIALPAADDPKFVATSSSASSTQVDSDISNPADDKSHEQKTCVTLPTSSSGPSSCEVTKGQTSSNDTQKVTATETTQASHSCCSRTCACELSTQESVTKSSDSKNSLKQTSNSQKTEADSGIDSDGSLIDDTETNSPTTSTSSMSDSPNSAKLRQTCITEFVRPKKPITSTFKVPEPLNHSSSYSKKRPASSLQDQLNQPPHKKVLLHLRA